VTSKPPRGIYVVAVVFFLAGLLCIAELVSLISAALGINPAINLANLAWVLPLYVLGLCLVAYGAAMLARLHSAPQWLLWAMTIFLTVRLATMPAGDSPFYSEARIYLNRFLLVLPLIMSSAYLVRLRARLRDSKLR
jgi:hypothetical protein